MKRPPSNRQRPGGFALVVVLIILSMLLVVAVGFLASMTTERTTANAFSNKQSAEQAAQAGVDSAVAMLRENLQAFPDSATVWDSTQSANSDGTYNEGASLYVRARGRTDASGNTVADPTVDNRPPAQPDPRQTFVLPLVSGVPRGNARLVSTKASILPVLSTTEADPSQANTFEQTYTDLNVRRYKGDTQGAIGSPPTWTATAAAGGATPSPKPARALWINTTSDVKHTPTITTDDPVTSRYAFWIEDESFRANVSFALPVSRADNTTQFVSQGTARGMLPADATLQGVLAAVPPSAGLPTLSMNSNSIADAAAGLIKQIREEYPNSLFLEPMGLAHGFTPGFTYPAYADTAGNAAQSQARYLDQLRYLTTTTSSSLNLSRHGSQRLNLNGIVASGGSSYSDARQKLQQQINQIHATLVYHAPDWGQRFYRQSATRSSAALNSYTDVIAAHAPIYFYKTAANLHDYIDADAQPTMIASGGNVAALQTPSPLRPFGDNGPNPMWAQGKDSVPFLQEMVVRFRPVVNTNTQTYDLKVDYYIEFWNMTDKDIYAGVAPAGKGVSLNGAFVRVSDQQTWVNDTNTPLTSFDGTAADPYLGAPLNGRTDYNIDLANQVSCNGALAPAGVVFKAGCATVITTDPDYQFYLPAVGGPSSYGSATGFSNPDTTFYCASLSGDSGLPGKREYQGPLVPPGSGSTPAKYIEPVFRDGTQDYGTEVTLYNSRGYLDCFQFALAEGASPQPSMPGSNTDYNYGGSLFGNNTTISQMGDPRTNNEQISYTRYENGSTGAPDQSRYFNGTHTLGYPNNNYVVPDSNNPWPDYYKQPVGTPSVIYPNPTFATAPMVVADAPLTSIGQIGDVFDPARAIGTVGSDGATGSRGGGRTYKIGQRDDLYSSDPSGNTNYSGVDNIPASTGWASWRLTDMFCISDDIELPARVNINGVARDNGSALRTLLTGFNFQPLTSDPNSASTGPPSDPVIHGDTALAAIPLTTNTNDVALNSGSPGYRSSGPTTYPAGTPLGFQRLVYSMMDRVNPVSAGQTPRPFFERGEIGELGNNLKSIFGLTKPLVTNMDLTGSNINTVFDHTREELSRRIMEQICTRGDVFTVYAVGQAVTQAPPNPNGATAALKNPPKKVAATQRLRVTFRLRPKNADGSAFQPGLASGGSTGTFNDFDPGNTTASNPRFAAPSRYDVEVLYASSF